MFPTENARAPAPSSGWPIAGLIAFSAMPLAFGVLRLLELAGLSRLMPPVSSAPGVVVPLVAHIVAASVFALLGALQFSPAIRRRSPVWHRRAGRLAWSAGLLVAYSALWLSFDAATQSPGGLLLVALRLVVACALIVCLILGMVSISRRDVSRHRDWMLRAYALGLGAATQMLVLMVAAMISGGPPNEMARALLMGLAWAINVGFAEARIALVRRGRPPAITRRQPHGLSADHAGSAVGATGLLRRSRWTDGFGVVAAERGVPARERPDPRAGSQSTTLSGTEGRS